jgi:hypothetical protein
MVQANFYNEQVITVFEDGKEFDVVVPEPIENMVVYSPFTNKEVMTVSYNGEVVDIETTAEYGFTEDGNIIYNG